MLEVLHEPGLSEADVDRLLGELALGGQAVPLLAVAGTRVVLASRMMLALFGADDLAGLGARLARSDPGARRLLQLALDMPVGGAPRLERLRFFFGPSAEPLTFLCRTVVRGGERLLVAAVLTGRSPVAAGTTPASIDSEPAPPPPVVADPATPDLAALKRRLREHCPSGRQRFVWRCGPDGRIGDIPAAFAELVGMSAAALVGADLASLAERWAMDGEGRLAAALRTELSWSVPDLRWPVAGEPAYMPVDLGGMPQYSAEGHFEGFRGFGLARVDRVAPAARVVSAAPPSSEPAEVDAAPPRADDVQVVASAPPTAFNIVPLRRPAAVPVPASPKHLSSAEETAFQEIALLLASPTPPGDGKPPAPPPAPPSAPPSPAQDATPDHAALLDGQAAGVLVCRDDRILYANRAARERIGTAGLAHAVSSLIEGDTIATAAGERVPAGIDRRMCEWGGQPAELLTLWPHSDYPAAPSRSESEAEELTAILDTASDGVVLLDVAGHVLGINRTGEALFGQERADVVGRSFDMLIAPESRSVAQHYFEARLASGVKNLLNDGCELVGLAAQGGTFPLFMTVSTFGAGDRTFCALLRDMTHWRKVERDLEEARREAERASAAKTDFLAKVSHEIRTPLNAIIGFAEVIMDERLGSIGNERYRDYLRDIHASGTHVMSLVNDLLDLSKIDAGKMELRMEPVDLNGVLTGCITMMQVEANRERVIVRQSLTSSLPPVRADERAVKQIVLNLLSNALKFNEPGGQVIVATTVAEGGQALIRIRDTGIGMTDAEIETALEPFRTIATGKNTGTGLGLPLTKALVEANGAVFAIKSRKGEGTLVEIAFPAV